MGRNNVIRDFWECDAPIGCVHERAAYNSGPRGAGAARGDGVDAEKKNINTVRETVRQERGTGTKFEVHRIAIAQLYHGCARPLQIPPA